ncbi:MAG: peptidylprolyl isomerase, partial [bacterium]|nr:peptidylprolyl isomerase [bacterium]
LAQHILIKPEKDTDEAKAAAKAKLEAIRARIVSGEATFDAEAAGHSDCPSGKSNHHSTYRSDNRSVRAVSRMVVRWVGLARG